MTSPVRDTAGSQPAVPRRRWRRRRRVGPFASGRLDLGPGPLSLHDSSPEGPVMFRPKKRYIELGTVVAALVALGTAGLVAMLVYRATRVEVVQHGVEDGAAITTDEAEALELRFDFESDEHAADATLTVDGDVVEEPGVLGPFMVWRPPEPLAEGDHVIEVTVPRPVFGDSVHRWAFTVDGTPPAVDVPSAVEPVDMDSPAEVAGTVEAGARLTADGEDVEVDDRGRFTLGFDRPPAGPIALEATDRAGNRTRASVVVPVTYPGLRAVHVTAAAWSSSQLRDGVLRLVDEGRIDTVQIDLKDDTGTVGYDSRVPRALEIGAVTPHYDLAEAVATIEQRGARVVGRIAAFRDPTLVQAAWAAGQTDQVVQSVRGGPYEATGMFSNPASPVVRRYNLDIALEAVSRGVDDILWDDVRLPTGEPDTIVVPGLSASPADVVTGFLAEAHSALRHRGAYQGVTAVGMASETGAAIGQDVARMARNADYLAPQVYPGYWSSGRYGVADPPRQPGEFARAIMARYQEATAGTGVVLAPWLQDFDLQGVAYGDGEVRAMVGALQDLGIDRFLLWSPSVQYSAGGIDPVR
ncbi:MAG TPA: putative glycoside hydrolase [Acidimicrobiales bacterium]